jgi:hypothetical protein
LSSNSNTSSNGTTHCSFTHSLSLFYCVVKRKETHLNENL